MILVSVSDRAIIATKPTIYRVTSAINSGTTTRFVLFFSLIFSIFFLGIEIYSRILGYFKYAKNLKEAEGCSSVCAGLGCFFVAFFVFLSSYFYNKQLYITIPINILSVFIIPWIIFSFVYRFDGGVPSMFGSFWSYIKFNIRQHFLTTLSCMFCSIFITLSLRSISNMYSPSLYIYSDKEAALTLHKAE